MAGQGARRRAAKRAANAAAANPALSNSIAQSSAAGPAAAGGGIAPNPSTAAPYAFVGSTSAAGTVATADGNIDSSDPTQNSKPRVFKVAFRTRNTAEDFDMEVEISDAKPMHTLVDWAQEEERYVNELLGKGVIPERLKDLRVRQLDRHREILNQDSFRIHQLADEAFEAEGNPIGHVASYLEKATIWIYVSTMTRERFYFGWPLFLQLLKQDDIFLLSTFDPGAVLDPDDMVDNVLLPNRNKFGPNAIPIKGQLTPAEMEQAGHMQWMVRDADQEMEM